MTDGLGESEGLQLRGTMAEGSGCQTPRTGEWMNGGEVLWSFARMAEGNAAR